ncbi:SNF2 family N-terminal domain-containing protein [Annulohypoxylon maeteangense]|uniref:SNF2 family N-terminal domain-containing protein n=1 Tax=Annulohypoxylon maeteangense TaxID=1927788 RepID=UPI002008ABEA|nr:SNF2 family N-terminal domain-containing protein [Annulohypoxylon maeteangense]KAI0885265.1 SNF2 family N-terminal domain-containing protein [Annulohypoxylon maeteangense]
MNEPSGFTAPAVANRPNTKSKLQHVLVKDPFPINFLSFLHAIPSDEDDGAAEPPEKRARIERPEAIPIAKDIITIRRPAQSEVPVTAPVTRVNAHHHIKVVHNETRRTLTVSSVPRSPYGSFKSELSLGHSKFSEDVSAILEILGKSKDDDKEDGALWVSVMVELERSGKRDEIRFYVELNWNSSTDILRPQRALSRTVLDTFFRTPDEEHSNEKLSPWAFYDAAFISQKSHSDPFSLTPPRLTSTLFPFQRRALQWLLNREGVEWKDECANGEPGLEQIAETSATTLPLSFKEVEDANGQSVYLSDLYHVVNRNITPFRRSEAAIRGGILAEEMGLGKTVETISLICTHTREKSPASANLPPQNGIASGATLIVTPLTLRNQWIAEFENHAPHLNIMVYEGLKGYDEYLVSKLAGKDVVITTYNTLQSEIYFAEQAPDRSLRHEKKYQRPKSPLAEICWWRVCLDEAQQIESGVSNAAKVARLIPRINSWGITGTPIKENIKDLWGLLVFLRYEPFASSTPIWEGLITSHKHLFKPLFNRIALRHTKRAVRAELTLPRQNRYVITIPFTAVEEQRYKEQFLEVVKTITEDETGESLREDWDALNPLKISQIQSALASLRQATLHPSLGPTRLGRDQRKALRTVDEVLDAMIEQSEFQIRSNQRLYLLEKLKMGQILECLNMVKEAMQIWKEVLDETEVLLVECRTQLQEELDKAKQIGADSITSPQKDEDLDGESGPGRIGDCRRRLRTILDVLHRTLFFIASGYYQLKVDEANIIPDSKEFQDLDDKEVSQYQLAKITRQELLHEAYTKVTSSIAKAQDKAKSQSFAEIPEIEFPDYHGLESRKFLETFQMLAEVLNQQADLVDEWRETIIQMLVRPLVDEDDEAEITGEEYEDSTKLQDELMVYTLALRAAIADRQDAVSGLQNERIKYDTRFAERQAKDGQGHAPEKVLYLLRRRQELKPNPEWGSFRGIVTNLRELATKLRHEVDSGKNRARVELEIVESQLHLVQKHSTIQSKSVIALESELNTFVAATNARVEYYKQLQGISDTVAPLDEEKATTEDLNHTQLKASRIKDKIDEALPKHRYLLHLKKSGQKEEEVCVICQCPFALGVLTPCGHQFCKECILHWFRSKYNCPVCKKFLVIGMLHDITLKKPELRIRQELPGGAQEHPHGPSATNSPSKSRNSGIYSEFGSEKLEAIRNIELPGARTSTKIDTLARHLIWLRVEDPGAKSVIFSQFPGFLEILADAFDSYQIGHTSFKTRNGIKKFKEDPAIECFLMDARAHASGLNLINASHVFLCEPLLNTALELQAIARVDRIGQEHDTTVWLYLIDGTVEESIYNLSVQRRLEHMRNNSGEGTVSDGMSELSDLNLEAANSRALEEAKPSKLMNKDLRLGEIVPVDDLWQCLFGHVAREKVREADADDARRNNPAVMGFLAGEAAEARRAEAETETE